MPDDFRQTPLESEDQSTVLQFVMMFVAAFVATIAIFIAFLIWGAVAGEFLNGYTPRLLGAGALALLFPTIAGISVMGRDVDQAAVRWSRAFMSIAVVSFGGAVLACLFLTPMVLDGLEQQPNWFFAPEEQRATTGLPAKNRELSLKLAEAIADAVGKSERVIPP